MNGLPYYKAYPRDFIEGTIGMSFETKGAYRLVLDLIYMQGGNLPDDPRYISGLLGCSIRKWKSLRAALVEAGKLRVKGEFLTNQRAENELETLSKLQDIKRENRAGIKKNKHLQKRPSDHTEPEPDITQAKACDGEAVESQDFAKQLFDRGVAFLGRHGTRESQARAIIGKWRKAYTDTDIFDAFTRCSRQGAVDPVPWITAALNGKTKGKANDRSAKGSAKLSAFVGGATGAPHVDWGQDCDTPRPLLARR